MTRTGALVALAVVLAAIASPAGAADGGGADFACPALPAPGYCGDGGDAAASGLALPVDVAVRGDGAYAIADAGNDAVRLVNAAGRITTLLGGDPAAAARLSVPESIAWTSSGALLIADTGNDRVLELRRDGRIRTLAGGTAARRGRLSAPAAVAVAPGGGVYVADTGNNRVRRVRRDGTVTTVAGLVRPVDVVALPDGSLAVVTADGRVWHVARDRTIARVPLPRLGSDAAIAAAPDGGLLVSDPRGRRILGVAPGGAVREVLRASSCVPGALDPIAVVRVLYPSGLTATADGGVLVADSGGDRVVRVGPAGMAAVAAGGGLAPGTRGCGRSATPPEVLKRLRAPLQSDLDYGVGAAPPSCTRRTFWTFRLRYRFTRPDRPRVRRRFTILYSSSRRVRVQVTARRGRTVVRSPRRATLTKRAQFGVVFKRGLPRAGRYRVRLVARAGSRRQCIDRTLRILRR